MQEVRNLLKNYNKIVLFKSASVRNGAKRRYDNIIVMTS